MSETPPVRVLVCDDDPMIYEVLSELIAEQPDMQVVGVATDAAQAVEPDVVILDMRMPGTGIHAAREIRQMLPGTRILVFSAYADRASITSMRAAGADEHLLKGVRNQEVLAMVRGLAQRGVPG